MWYRLAKTSPGDAAFDRRVKALIHRSKFCAKLFQHFGIPLRDLWRVQFHVAELQDSHAESDGDDITIDSALLKQPLEDVMHVIVHELSHWLTHKREQNHYFADPEEIEAFEWAIAHEMHRGRSMDQIVSVFQPLISKNSDPREANGRLAKLISKARRRL